jgi:hypothetical protein
LNAGMADPDLGSRCFGLSAALSEDVRQILTRLASAIGPQTRVLRRSSERCGTPRMRLHELVRTGPDGATVYT